MAEKAIDSSSNTMELKRGNADELVLTLLAQIQNTLARQCQLQEQTQVLLTELLKEPLYVEDGKKVENG